ncbi:MAG: hypothetical protein SPI42_10160 [Lactobacillus johnsonii]|nr:hypothetical protein [Lactobacillus johnsonii]
MKPKITATIEEMVEYKKQGLTNVQIGEKFNCSKTTVNNFFKKYNFNYKTFEYSNIPIQIKTEASGNPSSIKKNIPIETLIDLHNQGLLDREIAEKVGINRSTVTQRLNQAGITNRKSKINNLPLRNQLSESLKGRMTGELNPNWKGYLDEKRIARGIFKTISNEMIRNSGYHCHICGKKSQVYHTHHIKPFALILEEFLANTYSGNIDTFYEEITNYPDFMDRNNLIVVCPECHRRIHYSDDPELSPYRYNGERESATTIESIDEIQNFVEEASRVESSDSKCKESERIMI